MKKLYVVLAFATVFIVLAATWRDPYWGACLRCLAETMARGAPRSLWERL